MDLAYGPFLGDDFNMGYLTHEHLRKAYSQAHF